MGNVAKIVVDAILARMTEAENRGEIFRWVKPFSEGAPDRAYSYDTQKPYQGLNRLLLDNNEYLTFNKVQELNQRKNSPQYQIRKGAKGNIVCYYNTQPVIDKETGLPMMDETTGEEIKRGYLRYYKVFCREDIVRRDNVENLPSHFEFKHYSHEEITEQMRIALDRFNRLFNYYCKKHGIAVEIIKDGTSAYFSMDMRIRVPEMSNFDSVYSWITTLAHEMAHSTGVFLGRFDNMQKEAVEEQMATRSREELIAEISSQIIAAELQIEDDSDNPDNAVAYIQSWSSFLKDKPNEVISAAAKAEKATALILECLREIEIEEKKEREQEECR